MDPVDVLVTNAAELATCRPPKGGARGQQLRQLATVPDGAVAIRDGRIVAVGPTAHLRHQFTAPDTIDASGRLVTPGLIDPHTHLVFAGTRHAEWEANVLGRPTADLAGGIRWTIEQTRAAARHQLRRQALDDLDVMLAHGTTVAEAKTGYGLDRDGELRLLRVLAALEHPVEVVPTYLGAHVLPAEYRHRREEYVDAVIAALPDARKLARYCDVCCDPVALTPTECRRIAAEAQRLGLGLRVHADQTADAGGAAFAAAVGATSADHLESSSDDGIRILADSDTVGVLVPGVAFHQLETIPQPTETGLSPPPRPDVPAWARRLVDSGAHLALATDYNPGTSPTRSMQTVMQLAARLYRLNYAEIWHMATINAAAALDRAHETGSLEPGKRADLLLWNVPQHGMVIHQFGTNLVNTVVKAGQVVHPQQHGARRVELSDPSRRQ